MPVIENGTVSLVLGELTLVDADVEQAIGTDLDEDMLTSYMEDSIIPDLLSGLAEGPLANLPLPTLAPSQFSAGFAEDLQLTLGDDMDVVHLKGTLGFGGDLH